MENLRRCLVSVAALVMVAVAPACSSQGSTAGGAPAASSDRAGRADAAVGATDSGAPGTGGTAQDGGGNGGGAAVDAALFDGPSREPTASDLTWCNVTPKAGSMYWIDAAKGDDANPGTEAAPWKTLDHAVKTIQGGDTVTIAAGIYTMADSFTFGPKGGGHNAMTTFRAAPGARVLFTSAAGEPPNGTALHDYVRLERLWFGGTRVPDLVTGCDITKINVGSAFQPGNNDDVIGSGKQILGCTFFGYSELGMGTNQDIVFAGNRFVLDGRNCHAHPIYVSGGADNPMQVTLGECSQHIIVDGNIFIGNEGWSIHGYHRPFSGIVTRNFLADSYRGFVWDGTDVLLANNFFWKETGVIGTGDAGSLSPGGALLYGGHDYAVVMNNVFGPSSPLEGAPTSNDRITNNAFLGETPSGGAPLTLTAGHEAADLGISASDLDAVIQQIEGAFKQPASAIYADATIEPAFAKLQLKTPAGSALEGAGLGWQSGAQSGNIGIDAPQPTCIDALWDAFHAVGLRDVDRWAKLPDGGAP